ncbi:MAG TPA: membrane protein insertion efficiency factor YidD [Acidimicrobiales bacterium]|nr:membrane protein insertion efficiency factor YidD [Acidimicrobiales bacterium]
MTHTHPHPHVRPHSPDPVAAPAGPPIPLAARIVVGAIRGYQLARAGRVSPCRFTPTCSQYAVEAFTRHGVRRGLRLTLARLVRCRPGGPFGLDPVPE